MGRRFPECERAECDCVQSVRPLPRQAALPGCEDAGGERGLYTGEGVAAGWGAGGLEGGRGPRRPPLRAHTRALTRALPLLPRC